MAAMASSAAPCAARSVAVAAQKRANPLRAKGVTAPIRRARSAVRVSAEAETAVKPEDLYEVTLEKPIDVKFMRGADGGAYCVVVPPEPQYDDFEIGDKILKISASFGNEIWEAESYGQVMYAMKNRSGDIYLQMQKNYGDTSKLTAEKTDEFKTERAGGNYGAGTKEQQMTNYSKKRELENQRLDLFDEAIDLYNKGDFDNALINFEEVAALEPKNYMADNFSTSSELLKVSTYNIACCFSKLGKNDLALQSLKRCMGAGFENYKQIRNDKSLEGVRKDPRFKELIDKFDEPLFNENAFNVFKGMFGGGK